MLSTPMLRLFDDIAPTYDLLNHLLSFNVDRLWRRQFVRLLDLESDAIVLDVCTGTADIIKLLAQRYPNSTIYGLDFSASMLTRGQHKCRQHGQTAHIQFIQGDALCLPFADHTFHALCIAFGLRNLPDVENSLREMYRVLKSSGQLAILEFAPPPHSCFGVVYCLYLQNLLPFIGRLISRSDSAYQYLAASIQQFLEPKALIQHLRENGFQDVNRQRFMGGLLYGYYARKV